MADTKAGQSRHAYLSATLRDLKARSGGLDIARAKIEPHWSEDEVGLEESPFMEAILIADMRTCVLYANTVKDNHLKTAGPGAPKHSWALFMMPAHEAVAGGPADDLKQAQQFARSAYQATCGLIVGGDA